MTERKTTEQLQLDVEIAKLESAVAKMLSSIADREVKLLETKVNEANILTHIDECRDNIKMYKTKIKELKGEG